MIFFRLIFIIAALSSYCSGQEAQKGLFYNQTFGFSWNPLGVIVDSKIAGRIPLYPSKKGILWESSRMELSIQNEWTPADNLLSFSYMVEPIAFFSILMKAGYYSMYNELGFGCFRMDIVSCRYDAKSKKNGLVDNARGYWLSLSPSLKLQIRKMICINNASINKIKINGSGYYLEVRSNQVHAVSDFNIGNDSFLLYKISNKVMSGLRYRYTGVLRSKISSQIAGLAVIIQPEHKKIKGLFIFCFGGIYTDDPLYKGKINIGLLAGKELSLK